ncbi:MAG: glycoside hydrolase family 3 N-terminal domain-containing protein [Solirubrobacterales bacterium]
MNQHALLAAPVLLAIAVGAAGPIVLDRDHERAQPDPASSLSVRQLAGQRIVYSYTGTRVPSALVTRVRRGEAAGVILFTRNIGSRAQLRAAMARLQRAARSSELRLPLLVMIDQEGGLVKRLGGAPSHSPAQLGSIGRASLARHEGSATARNLRSVGVNVNLAPVLDVGRRGSFQRRTGRSYGSDPKLVGSLGSAFALGLQRGDVAATLKHFPGIGVVRNDEDLVVQRVALSRSRLRAIDEAPFAKAIDAGAKLVMTSTAVYPACDRAPALLSRTLSTDELRTRLGFTGVSITDDLEVPAMRRYGSAARLGLRAARAGSDLLMFAQHYRVGARALASLTAAARGGRLSEDELRASARRVLELRQSLR